MKGYLRIDADLKCNFWECIAGGGVAGDGHCFLHGDPEKTNCAEYISELGYETVQEAIHNAEFSLPRMNDRAGSIRDFCIDGEELEGE